MNWLVGWLEKQSERVEERDVRKRWRLSGGKLRLSESTSLQAAGQLAAGDLVQSTNIISCVCSDCPSSYQSEKKKPCLSCLPHSL